MRGHLLVLALLLLPGVTGQEAVGQEDFEDDVVGQLPTEAWYNTFGFLANNGISTTSKVVTCPGNAAALGGLCFSPGNAGASSCGLGAGAGPCGVAFFFKEGNLQPSFIEFVLDNAGSTLGQIDFCASAASPASIVGASNCAVGSLIFRVDLRMQSGDCRLRVNLGGSFDELVITPSGSDCSRVWRVEMDWQAQEYTVTLDGGAVNGPYPFRSSQSSMAFVGVAKGSDGLFRADNIQVDGAVESADDVREPAEFDQGLKDLLAQLGFISEGSQMFFILLLVGLLTFSTAGSMRLLAPSKLKNNLIAAIPALFAIFGIFIGFLDLWMFLISLVLAEFVVNAGGVIRNSYFDLVQSLRSAADSVVEQISGTEPIPQGSDAGQREPSVFDAEPEAPEAGPDAAPEAGEEQESEPTPEAELAPQQGPVQFIENTPPPSSQEEN